MTALVSPAELGRQLGYSLEQLAATTPDATARTRSLELACDAAATAIAHDLGWSGCDDPAPDAVLRSVALSVAVDVFKQADATFGIIGQSETGAVRIARDLMARYAVQLHPYRTESAWGIA